MGLTNDLATKTTPILQLEVKTYIRSENRVKAPILQLEVETYIRSEKQRKLQFFSKGWKLIQELRAEKRKLFGWRGRLTIRKAKKFQLFNWRGGRVAVQLLGDAVRDR